MNESHFGLAKILDENQKTGIFLMVIRFDIARSDRFQVGRLSGAKTNDKVTARFRCLYMVIVVFGG